MSRLIPQSGQATLVASIASRASSPSHQAHSMMIMARACDLAVTASVSQPRRREKVIVASRCRSLHHREAGKPDAPAHLSEAKLRRYAINGIASEAISSARDRDGGRRNDRGGGRDCLHGDLASPAITKAARQVIVDQPDALHQGVDDRRADKSEPTPAKVGR